MLTSTGTQLISALVAGRTVDNAAGRGTDVQATNKSGGTAGHLDTGDSFRLTYSEEMTFGSLATGWTAGTTAPAYVRAIDGAVSGGSGSNDRLRISSDAAGTTDLHLGSIQLGQDFVKSNQTAVFAATLTATAGPGGGTTGVTVTLGAINSGSSQLRTVSTKASLIWTPSALAKDLAGNAGSVTPVTETGTSDIDF